VTDQHVVAFAMRAGHELDLGYLGWPTGIVTENPRWRDHAKARPEKTNCTSIRKARGKGRVEKNPQERGTFSGVVGGADVAKMWQLKKCAGAMAIRLLICETMKGAREETAREPVL
jgi:hypothetical protein